MCSEVEIKQDENWASKKQKFDKYDMTTTVVEDIGKSIWYS